MKRKDLIRRKLRLKRIKDAISCIRYILVRYESPFKGNFRDNALVRMKYLEGLAKKAQ